MPSVTSRKIFIWSLPALFIFSFLWYKRKKGLLRSDPGGTDSKSEFNTAIDSSSDSDQCTEVVKVKKTVIAEVHPVLIDTVVAEQKSERKIQESLAVTEVVDTSPITSAEATADKDIYSLGLVEIDQLTTNNTGTSQLQDNIVVELICEAEKIPRSTTSTLNPVVPNFLVETNSIVIDSKDRNQVQTPVHFDTKETALCTDLDCLDKIHTKEPVSEILVIPIVESIVSGANTSDNKVSLTCKEEEAEVKVDQGLQEEQGAVEKKVHSSLNKSWGDESELETDKEDRMARMEVSSDSTLEGTAVEDDNSVSSMHVEVASLESKLSSLEMKEVVMSVSGTASRAEALKAVSGAERDSANHSPAEVMLGSPSLSSYSDSQSEGSSDSGKGCSDVATPPSRTPASGSSVSGDVPVTSVYEFVLPQFLVGRLIGRHGAFVNDIKAKTHANILIKRHPETNKVKICAIEGTSIDIESALEMIRQKFPLKRYPNVTLEQVSFLNQATYPLMPENFQLQLVEGVNNDVILSSLISPVHFFLQQPTHPTFPSLNRLNVCMNFCYNEPMAPALPTPITESVICVAPTMGAWYRAQVISSSADTEMSVVKFVDYGGYQEVENGLLRQIRSDFITLPFQAAECYLANVKPVDGVWACEAVALVEELTHGQVIQAQIHGYAEDGVPVVYLFSVQGTQVLVVNRELVLRGYAEWDEPTEEVQTVAEIET